jgi:hypothetical protein
MAFERDSARCSADHSWICLSNNLGSRMPTNGSRPVAGLLFSVLPLLPALGEAFSAAILSTGANDQTH